MDDDVGGTDWDDTMPLDTGEPAERGAPPPPPGPGRFGGRAWLVTGVVAGAFVVGGLLGAILSLTGSSSGEEQSVVTTTSSPSSTTTLPPTPASATTTQPPTTAPPSTTPPSAAPTTTRPPTTSTTTATTGSTAAAQGAASSGTFRLVRAREHLASLLRIVHLDEVLRLQEDAGL